MFFLLQGEPSAVALHLLPPFVLWSIPPVSIRNPPSTRHANQQTTPPPFSADSCTPVETFFGRGHPQAGHLQSPAPARRGAGSPRDRGCGPQRSGYLGPVQGGRMQAGMYIQKKTIKSSDFLLFLLFYLLICYFWEGGGRRGEVSSAVEGNKICAFY